MSMSILNDDIHDTVLNITLKVLKSIENMFWNIQLRVPESDTDQNFEKNFFTTDVNVGKLTQGVRGNFIISTIYDNIVKSLEYDLKFPMKSVSWDHKFRLFQSPHFTV